MINVMKESHHSSGKGSDGKGSDGKGSDGMDLNGWRAASNVSSVIWGGYVNSGSVGPV